jgi:hypothetical protein
MSLYPKRGNLLFLNSQWYSPQKMALDLEVDQQIAKLVIMYPAIQSRGITTPTNDVRTNGKKLYPNTLAF